jgi:capsular polysaccharide biosynthesis protein
MYMGSHEINFFQHFLDNGVPHISLMQFASGIDPSTVTFVLDGWSSDAIPHLLKRYGFKDVIDRAHPVSARQVILPHIVPVIHPLLTQGFIDRLALNHSVMDKVILVSRGSDDGTKQSRIVNNQGDLAKRLSETYGDKFVLFRAHGTSTADAVALFQQAAIVIGSHGGAMYHALWASRQALIVELMPIGGGGEYPWQGSLSSMPPFAHLAIYTNSMMNGQRFFRWYEIGVDINFNVNVDKFMLWLENISTSL